MEQFNLNWKTVIDKSWTCCKSCVWWSAQLHLIQFLNDFLLCMHPIPDTWHLDILWTNVQNIEENVNLHLALLFDLIFKSMLKGCQNRNGCRNSCWSKHQNFSEPKYNSCVITSDIGKLSFTNLQNLRFPGKITFADRGVWPLALIFIRALI